MAVLGNSSTSVTHSGFFVPRISSGAFSARSIGFTTRAFLNKPLQLRVSSSDADDDEPPYPSVVVRSLKVLEWDKVCDSVVSFAATSLGKQATREQLCLLTNSYEDSLRLLEETKAVVKMHQYGAMMNLVGIDLALVKSAIQSARRFSPVSESEALAIVDLLKFAETLQFNIKAAIKVDSEWYQHFMPLSEVILELVISKSLMNFILQLIDEDGSIKDSASSAVKQSRNEVRLLERKLYQLMEKLIRSENIDGPYFEASAGSILEPLPAVQLNNELQHARECVSKAEAEVLLRITNKMQMDLDDIEIMLKRMIELDVINARARYSVSFGGSFPDLYLPQDKSLPDNGTTMKDRNTVALHPTQRNWTLYLPKAYHPLLLQKHRQKQKEAMNDVHRATSEMRRRKGGVVVSKKEVADLEQTNPVPFDIFVANDIRVVVITGPNTGGKTIFLKTVGLAIMMAKSGLYALASEPVKIPWCDFVFADIGDEQSLSQSLSTFSGHLKQISEILSHSTNLSFVVLDEVGAGTNPLEGAALGMSLLESFAEAGPLLTLATTHHGELKTLKYSNNAFENACMEFDEVNLKPTFRILWGVPGRSNAINIAERLGMPNAILENARELYGASSTEINEIILDMERFKQTFHKQILEAQEHLMLSKDLHKQLILTRKKITEYSINKSLEMLREISKAAAAARSILHERFRQLRALVSQDRLRTTSNTNKKESAHGDQNNNGGRSGTSTSLETTDTCNLRQPFAEKRMEIPKEGDMVQVPALNQKALVLKVDSSKEEILVQYGKMKLKLKMVDVVK